LSPATHAPDWRASVSSNRSAETGVTVLGNPLPGPKFEATTPLSARLNSSETGPAPLPSVAFSRANERQVARSASSRPRAPDELSDGDGDIAGDSLGELTSALRRG
jgi:hypothetical protein